MRNKVFWIGLVALFCLVDLCGQNGSAFGIKVGPTVGFQSWTNGRESEPLIRYHALAYIETYGPEAPYALFAQAGYHVRGGALRLRAATFTTSAGDIFSRSNRAFPYEFNNVSLALGAKQRFLTNNAAFYYMVGIRGEYTVSDNLRDYHPEGEVIQLFNLIHPFPGSNVRRVNYGVIAGGGIDFMFSELVGGMVEISISPDFSSQYKAASINFTDFSGNQRPTGERDIKNISVELSFGIRLLRIVEYVDEVY